MTESEADLVCGILEGFSRKLIAQGVTSREEAVKKMVEACDGFKTCVIFQEYFPRIFMIELCKHEIAKRHGLSANDPK